MTQIIRMTATRAAHGFCFPQISQIDADDFLPLASARRALPYAECCKAVGLGDFFPFPFLLSPFYLQPFPFLLSPFPLSAFNLSTFYFQLFHFLLSTFPTLPSPAFIPRPR